MSWHFVMPLYKNVFPLFNLGSSLPCSQQSLIVRGLAY